jgi:hypothetical protein
MNGEWFSAKLHAIVDAFDRIGLQPSVDAPIRGEEAWDMPAPSFIAWLEAMASHPFYKSEHEAALALGVTDSAVEIMKREGADTRTALACRALLHRLEPYS